MSTAAKKKVLILTYYWPPSGGAGVQRILKFVKYLPEFGYAPYVITVDEHSASYPILDASLTQEIPSGLPVFRTPSFEPLAILSRLTGNKAPYGGFANKDKERFSQKMLRFIRGNFFIPDARNGWVQHAFRRAASLMEQEQIDTFLITSPPHSAQLIGLKLKKKFPNSKWIADLRDPWTDIFYYKDMLHTKAAAAKDAAYEKKVLEAADAVIVVSEPIRKSLLSKSERIRQEKFHVIPNGFDPDDFLPKPVIRNSSFTITYVGTMADRYNPEVFFKALEKALTQKKNVRVTLRFVGGRTESIQRLVQAHGLDSITGFIDHVDHSKAIEYMQSSDALLLVIPDVTGSAGILTGKLFEYLAAGRPIVCIGPRNGEAAAIIADCKAGEVYERTEGDSLSLHLDRLLTAWLSEKSMQPESRTFEKFSRRNLTRSLAEILS